jgi:hypothetical protein
MAICVRKMRMRNNSVSRYRLDARKGGPLILRRIPGSLEKSDTKVINDLVIYSINGTAA